VAKAQRFAYSRLEGVNGKGFKDSRYARSRKDPDRWIQATGEPLDQNLRVVSRIGGSKVERISFRLQKSRSVEHRGLVRTRGTSVRWGPRG
jgi:hypothetical protein